MANKTVVLLLLLLLLLLLFIIINNFIVALNSHYVTQCGTIHRVFSVAASRN